MIGAVAPIVTPKVDWLAVAPEVALGAAGVLIVLTKALMRRRRGVFAASIVLAFLGVLTAGGFIGWQWENVRHRGPFTTIRRGRCLPSPESMIVSSVSSGTPTHEEPRIMTPSGKKQCRTATLRNYPSQGLTADTSA